MGTATPGVLDSSKQAYSFLFFRRLTLFVVFLKRQEVPAQVGVSFLC